MRYFLSLTLLSVLLITQACNKKYQDQPADNYEMTFMRDGISDTLITSYCTIKPNSLTASITDFTIDAHSKDFKINVGITIQMNGIFNTGVYETSAENNFYKVIANYYKDLGESGERIFTIDNDPEKPNGSFTITITSIDNNLVKGTFSCNYLYDRIHDETITITDGSFVARRL
jgi:hypothetical protein